MSTHKTACILCSLNCGLEITTEAGRITKVRGDADHPVSRGYLCQKAARLDHYQNNSDRLDSPLRRRPDGTFEPISWDTAIAEIAAELVRLRDRHGGKALAYYGGGGQGNHLGGIYGSALRSAMGTRYYYSALAQEKTGDFWVNGKLFGRQTCHITEDIEHADLVLFIGTNPWQAHGIPRARKLVKELAADPARTMIVIDPRRTQTAKRADLHLAVKPGMDAFLLSAILAALEQEQLVDKAFIEARCSGYDQLQPWLAGVDVEDFSSRAGVDVALVRDTARRLAAAKSATVRADLGIQQSYRSTLNSYLEKLLFLVTGNLGKPGSNNFHTFFLPLIGHSSDESRVAGASGAREISKLYPPNVLPAEIDNDPPDRVRGLVVDSANPMVSGADTTAYGQAFDKLELLVVLDVAMSETARKAHYVLPGSSQLEKWESTFFNLYFPTNMFHLRAPILPPRPGTLPEPEIYRRLLVAMGAIPDRFPVLEAIARTHRKAPGLKLFHAALAATLAARPALRPYAAVILMATLGKALPDGAEAAAPLWFAAHRYVKKHRDAVVRAGLQPDGEALFQRILDSRSGTVLSTHRYEDTWSFIRHPDGRVHLDIAELIEQLQGLQQAPAPPGVGADFPLLLIAGERRGYNANTIYRNPAWRKTDADGALRMHPDDAGAAGLSDGAAATCESRRGSVQVTVRVDDTIRPGVVTLPHGYGMSYEGQPHGPLINLLTESAHCDPIAFTPYHKNVPVRVTAA